MISSVQRTVEILKKLNQATAKELWAAVKPRSQQPTYNRLLSNPYAVNSFFASVCYDKDAVQVNVSGCLNNDFDGFCDLIQPFEVKSMLAVISYL